ncbi:MAG: Regulatory protein RecX [Chlamydiia bacterium]|nr:Regulatory protein RecX [Chlamydiia bacterium]
MEEKRARALAIKQLSLRTLHSKELERYLKKKEISAPLIEKIVNESKQHGWIDDARWVEQFIEKLRRQGKSSLEILAKCQARGVGQQEVRPRLEGGNRDSLKIVISKKYSALLDRETSFAKKQKILGALYRKGFSISDIQSSIKEIEQDNSVL